MQEPQPWRVEDRRYVYDRKPYMTLREDTVRLPNGAVIPDYFVFEYPDWVSVLPVTPEGNIVLIRQYRHGIARVHYELVAGVVDPAEPLLQAGQRELLEETGYGGGLWQPWAQLSANPATHTNTCHIFLAEGVTKLAGQQLDATEDIAPVVLTPAEVKQALRTGGIFQALHAAALWRYFAEQ
jgi:8-oxo-dGTP pyrophosphatase MutT (NUDIX family)